PDGLAEEELDEGEVGEDGEAEHEPDRAEPAEEHHRAPHEPRQEDDGDEVEEAAEVALEPELRPPVLPRAVLHHLLLDAVVPLPLRQQRDVAVELAVDADAADDLGPVRLDAAVEVVERDARE